MTSRNHERGLTASQKRTLLWMPAVGLWLVLFLVSKNPEGGRDWSSFLLLGASGTVAYVIVWAGLMRLTDAKKRKAAEKEAAPKSRAEAIYGPRHLDETDDPGASDE
ncbi:MAG: hypothetical protein QM473_08355 [Acidobacteriota bacterium]|nr:hypothetical protein [Acidobacteriota bacterium]